MILDEKTVDEIIEVGYKKYNLDKIKGDKPYVLLIVLKNGTLLLEASYTSRLGTEYSQLDNTYGIDYYKRESNFIIATYLPMGTVWVPTINVSYVIVI